MRHAADVLPLHGLRFRLRPLRRMVLGNQTPGVMLRGAFGMALKAVACREPDRDACAGCPTAGACGYARVFEPSLLPDRPEVSRLRQDPPRPYVFRPAEPGALEEDTDAPWWLEVVLIGRAIDHADAVREAVMDAAHTGLGPARVPHDVESCQPTQIQDPDGTVRHTFDVRDLLEDGESDTRRVRVSFLTPTEIRHEGALLRRPSCADLVRSIRRRAADLALVHGTGPLAGETADVLALAAQAVRTESWDFSFAEAERRNRRNERQRLEGVVGSAVYAGPVGAFLPWLRLAEWIHVGKHASFGQGRIRVEVLA